MVQVLVDKIDASYNIFEVENIRLWSYCKKFVKVIEQLAGTQFVNRKRVATLSVEYVRKSSKMAEFCNVTSCV